MVSRYKDEQKASTTTKQVNELQPLRPYEKDNMTPSPGVPVEEVILPELDIIEVPMGGKEKAED